MKYEPVNILSSAKKDMTPMYFILKDLKSTVKLINQNNARIISVIRGTIIHILTQKRGHRYGGTNTGSASRGHK